MATIGEKEIKTDWPVEEGLIAGTTKQVGERFLVPEGINGVTSIVENKEKVGLE